MLPETLWEAWKMILALMGELAQLRGTRDALTRNNVALREQLAVQAGAAAAIAADHEQQLAALRTETARLSEENARLSEQQGLNSTNSSKPPSSDPPWRKRVRRVRAPSSRRKGGQPGHPGHGRPLLPAAQVDRFEDHRPPQHCVHDGGLIDLDDEPAERHQVFELPEVRPLVIEHRVWAGRCRNCRRVYRGKQPAGTPPGVLGVRALALVALLTGAYHLGKRAVAALFRTGFGLPLSVATVCQAERLVAAALALPFGQLLDFAQRQGVVNADETGHRMAGRRSWVWVLTTPLAVVFRVGLRRTKEAAQQVLGTAFAGILGSDRLASYAWVPLHRRQLCWSHLDRDFERMAERTGDASRIGTRLRLGVAWMFALWHEGRARDGPAAHAAFQRRMQPLIGAIEALLAEGAGGDDSATRGTCRALLKQREALWTFVREEGVEPTNNRPEQALRTYVIWRKISYGTQGERGNRFVERILSVLATCRAQGRDPLAYLVAAIVAHLRGEEAPSLLPTAAVSSAPDTFLATGTDG